MSLFEVGIVSLYYEDESGRMIFGFFTEDIDQFFGLWVVWDLFTLRYEAQPFASYFHREWCAWQFAQEACEFFDPSLAKVEEDR